MRKPGSPAEWTSTRAKPEIETSIQKKKALVRLWGQRGTLHLYATEDWPLVCTAMAAREIAHVERRRLKAGGDQPGLEAHESACRQALEILKRRPGYPQRVWHQTHVEPVLLVQGRIRGVWRYTRSARGLTIKLQLFDKATLSNHVKAALSKQAKAIADFFAVPLLDVETHVVK